MPRQSSAVPAPTRRKIVAKRAQGKTVRAIARETGVAKSTTHDIIQQSAGLLVDLQQAHELEWRAMYALMVRKLKTDINSRSQKTRYMARQHLIQCLSVTDQARSRREQQGALERGLFSLEELQLSIRRITTVQP